MGRFQLGGCSGGFLPKVDLGRRSIWDLGIFVEVDGVAVVPEVVPALHDGTVRHEYPDVDPPVEVVGVPQLHPVVLLDAGTDLDLALGEGGTVRLTDLGVAHGQVAVMLPAVASRDLVFASSPICDSFELPVFVLGDDQFHLLP